MPTFEKITLKNGEEPKLLAVLAHPDDETFGMGGTLAMYARRGVSVYLVCATKGEVGEMDPVYMEGFKSIADRREAELRCAAEKLGLAGVYFLGYRDSGMIGSPENHHPKALYAQPVENVAAEIADWMQKIKPQVVVTFDPIGGYRHPDHIAIHKATVKAFYLVREADQAKGDNGYRPAKLYYHTIQRGLLKIMVRIMPILGKNPRKIGKNQDIDLVSIAEVSYPTDAVINFRAVADVRDDASACHVSQGGGKTSGGIFGKARKWLGSKEIYMRAYPRREKGEPVERDLFEGL